jgi:hypothetical protein
LLHTWCHHLQGGRRGCRRGYHMPAAKLHVQDDGGARERPWCS